MEFILAGSVIGAGYFLSKGGKERQIKKIDLIEADPSENNIYESRHLDKTKAESKDLIEYLYSNGVPMGSDLRHSETTDPTFFVWAIRDLDSAALQRIQIVTGGIENNQLKEKVYDVVCSDGLKVDPVTNRCPDNGAKVDIETCSISNNGANELSSFWSDPDFNKDLRAFYYVRVLENPTCRWSTWDAIREGVSPRPDMQKTIQERAWSSPIHLLNG